MYKRLFLSILALSLVFTIACSKGKSNSGLFFLLMRGESGPVADPVFGPEAGTFGVPQSVSLSTSTSKATIRYTIDGSDPTPSSGSIYRTPVYIASTTTLRAIAYRDGWEDSSVVEGVYTIVPDQQVDTPSISPAPGEYNHVQNITITCAMSGASIKYTTNGDDPSPTHGTLYEGSFTVSASRTVRAIAYREGYLDSGIASSEYTLRPHTPTFSPVAGEYGAPQSVTIQSETDGATIRYTTDGSEPTLEHGDTFGGAIELAYDSVTDIRAKAFIAGWSTSEELAGTFTILPEGTVAKPVITPGTDTYDNTQEVHISCTTPDATIYYTTNGDDPAEYGTEYTAAFMVSETGTTVRAVAVKEGWTQSSEASATYTLKAAAPAFTPASGSFNEAQSVEITSATDDAEIYFTTNGDDPLESGTLYEDPITVDRTMTLRAAARKTSYEDSVINDSPYALSPLAPQIVPDEGEYSTPQMVTITCGTDGATIRYTTDGSEPTLENGEDYTDPFELGYRTTTTVRARAYKTGWNGSGISESGFTILPEGTVAAPSITPEETSRYADTEVTLSTTTADATIKYTTNGDDPKTKGLEYSTPFTLTASATVRAYAYKTGWNDSDVSEKEYELIVSDPSFSPDAGTYDDVQTVTISTTTPDAAIFCTTNGDDPATAGVLCKGAVTVDRSMTLRAMARKTGWTDSGASEAQYVMKAATPVFDAPAGSYSEAKSVEITSATPDVTIRYTTTGDDPTTETGTEYTGAVTVDASMTLKAIAYRDDWTASDVGVAVYSLNYGTVATPAFTVGTGTYDADQSVTISCDTEDAVIVYTTDNTEPDRENGTVYGGETITVDRTDFILKAFAYKSDWTDSSTRTATYTLQPATPGFSPDAGTYTGTQSVTITSTSGATIRYTTDGSDPTAETCPTCTDAASPVTVSVSQNTTITAYALRENWTDTEVAAGTYNIKVPTPTPYFPSGMYTGMVVTIGCSDSSASIKYTIDGTDPKTSGTAIVITPNSGFAVMSSMTLRAYAFKTGCDDSDEVSAAYIIRCPKNIALAPPYGSAYPHYPKNKAYTVTAPKTFGTHTFTEWRFDRHGDGSWDNVYNHATGIWQPSNQYAYTFTTAGTYNIFVQARTADDWICVFFVNGLKIVNGITSGTPSFTEINPGTLTGVQYSSSAMGDIDNDGDVDMILIGQSSSGNNISKIYRNDGTGTFSEINAGSLIAVYGGLIALGDIDGDRDLDLILCGMSASSYISKIYRNDGTGAFTEINSGSLPNIANGEAALGDIDGDADLDLILSGYNGSAPISKIYRNDGTGAFIEINTGQLADAHGSDIALGDIDGDGDLDMILSGYTASGSLSIIYQNNGSGSFTELYPGMLAGMCDGSLTLGDIDGDNDLDLILAGVGSGNTRIYQNNGSGYFSQIGALQYCYSTGSNDSTVLGDLDGDGDLDLIQTGNGISQIYQNNGSGSFTQISSGALAGASYSSLAFGDVDSDGVLDLILTGNSSGLITKIYRGVSQ